MTDPAENDAPVCRCECAYVGAQLAGTPIRCEQCGGLVDEIAAERMEAVYAESRRRLEERARTTRPIPPATWDDDPNHPEGIDCHGEPLSSGERCGRKQHAPYVLPSEGGQE